ncbi:MAG: hypothetical protein ABH986_03465 [archaeon]
MNKILLIFLIITLTISFGCLEEKNGIGKAVKLIPADNIAIEKTSTIQKETHSKCSNQQCIEVQGIGTNECRSNSDCTGMNLDEMLNMCYGLTQQECNQYKVKFVKTIIEKYKYYHKNSNELFNQYEKDNLFIEWDNNLSESIGSPVGGHFTDPVYSYPLTKIYNTDFNRVLEELKKKHIIFNYFVHGNPTTAGFGLNLNETESERNKIYTTNEEFINFAFENGSPALLVDAKACGSWIIWDNKDQFCCWPQAMTGSGVWLYMDPFGGYEYQQNLQKKLSSGEIAGKSLLEVSRSELYLHGDITAHLPGNGTEELSCGWANKLGVDCVCSPPEEKNKLGIIIKQNGIYNNPELVNSINQFIDAVKIDTGISGSLYKFSGSSFEELDSFIENLYDISNVAYVIIIGTDLPVAETIESDGLQLVGAQELGTVNNVIENDIGCYDVAISYILPPLHYPQNCKKGETNCVEGQLYKCNDYNWVSTGENC